MAVAATTEKRIVERLHYCQNAIAVRNAKFDDLKNKNISGKRAKSKGKGIGRRTFEETRG